MYKTLVHTTTLTPHLKDRIARLIQGEFEDLASHIVLHHEKLVDKVEVHQLANELKLDINTLPQGFDTSEVKLLISDMDSTLISIECVDEIADYMQLKVQVSAITEAAMRGEIDFETSLKKRVGLLRDLPESVLEKVYLERLALNPGAEQLIAGLTKRGIKTALVSGGFTFFTDKLQKKLKLDYTLANVLEIIDGQLTGHVVGGIVTATRKSQFLQQLCDTLGGTANQAIAVGDGANDLEMINLAGLGVAYHAKSIVQQNADIAINYGGLDSLLHYLS